MTLNFQDGNHDFISRRKVPPSGCSRSICVAYMQQPGTYALCSSISQFVIYSTCVVVV